MNPAYNEAAKAVADALEEKANANEISQFTSLCEHLDKLTDAASAMLRDYQNALRMLDEEGEDTDGGWDLAEEMEYLLDSSTDALFLRLIESGGWAGWPCFDDFSPDDTADELAEWEKRFNWTLVTAGSCRWVYLVTPDGYRLGREQFEAWEKKMEEA